MILNGNIFYEDPEQDTLNSFLKNIYKEAEIKYPKFFKMDNLSKLAFLAAELVLKEINSRDKVDTAIVFSNFASSLDTDRKYQSTINDPENYYPSPSVFVYTLPNICIGEISIRHQIKNENAFFIFRSYNAHFHRNYENYLIQTGKSKAVLGGWVDVDGENYEVFIYLISEKGDIQHTESNLLKLYKE